MCETRFKRGQLTLPNYNGVITLLPTSVGPSKDRKYAVPRARQEKTFGVQVIGSGTV